MMTQVQFEGEKYVTGCLIVPLIEQLRVGSKGVRDRLVREEFQVAVGDVDSVLHHGRNLGLDDRRFQQQVG